MGDAGGRREEARSPRTHQRGEWKTRNFVMAGVGGVIGEGNLWRFPILVSSSGGAAFLIPYFTTVLLVLPCFFVEVAIGQYSALPLQKLYHRLCPVFAGIGLAKIIFSATIALYYNMIIAWSIHYLCSSLAALWRQADLPWAKCHPDWGSEGCFDGVGERLENGSCWRYPANASWHSAFQHEDSDGARSWWPKTNGSHPAQEYLHFMVIGDWGSNSWFNWQSILALMAAWVLVVVCLVNHKEIASRFAYVTASLSFPLLACLFAMGLCQEGAFQGISYFILEPNWSMLGRPSVWCAAVSQVFFSLGLGTGELTTLSSYNKFHANTAKAMLKIVGLDCAASLLAGMAVFAVLGSLSHKLCVPMDLISKGGITLVFEAYPYALTKLSQANLWSCVFFLTLIVLGIDAQVALVEVQITCLLDRFPQHFVPQEENQDGGKQRTRKRMKMVVGVCGLWCVVGVFAFTGPWGLKAFSLLDSHAEGFPIMLVTLCEFSVVLYIYGFSRSRSFTPGSAAGERSGC